ncbi:MAG: FkbM family methyltransferase [Anaerolineales bacterium]
MRILKFISALLPLSVKQFFYRIPWLANAVRSLLNHALPKGLTEITISGGLIKGYRMSLDLQQEKDYWLGTYEIDLQRALRDFIKPAMIAYDVGANVGYISLMFAHLVWETGKVYAFEPYPQNLERLRKNIALNKLSEQIQVIPSAVADRSGEMEFWIGPSDDTGKLSGSAGRTNFVYKEHIYVPAISLDDFVFSQAYPAPNVIKMDIEGGEILALRGMQRLLAEYRPLIFLEVHGDQCAQAAWDVLLPFGYSLKKMHHGYPIITNMAQMPWKSYVIAAPRAV